MGSHWLKGLPRIVDSYATQWDLEIGEPLGGGSVSVVLGVKHKSQDAVLKINPPWSPVPITFEAAALQLWDGDCAPKLIRSDKVGLLLERIVPAANPKEPNIQDIVNLLKDMSRTARIADYIPPLFVSVGSRFSRASYATNKLIDKELLQLAYWSSTRQHSPASPGIIHGDFKNKNIIHAADGSFKVIDPDPAQGDVAYDAALWALSEPSQTANRCQEIGDYLSVDAQRIGAWTLILAVPEICLASWPRAEATYNYVIDTIGDDDLKQYFTTPYTSPL